MELDCKNVENTSKLIDASSETLVPDDHVDGNETNHLTVNGSTLNQSKPEDQKHDETVSISYQVRYL